MNRSKRSSLPTAARPVIAGLACYSAASSADVPGVVNPATMPVVGTVDTRCQSSNIEMLEVTGGRFWKPYKDQAAAQTPAAVGTAPDLYQYRPPVDLSQARRRKLDAALGPAYLRVSGTWANTTYFQDGNAAGRLQGRAHARALERRRRFFARCECRDSNFLRNQRRNPQCARRLDARTGARFSCLQQIDRWPDRGR